MAFARVSATCQGYRLDFSNNATYRSEVALVSKIDDIYLRPDGTKSWLALI